MHDLRLVGGKMVTVQRGPRIVVLVIASDNLGIYARHEACWRSYARSHPDVTVYFVRQREDAPGTYVDGDTIWSRGREATERTFDKTIAAFHYLQPSSYDYVVRTNLSSVWNFTKLSAFCATLPDRNVCCGVLGTPGVSGAGMIVSPDVVATLVRHSGNSERGMWDDVDFGRITEAHGIPSRPAPRCDPKSRADVDAQWDLVHHYYLKHQIDGVRNVDAEVDVMTYLISKIYRV